MLRIWGESKYYPQLAGRFYRDSGSNQAGLFQRLHASDLLARDEVGLLPLIAFTEDGKSIETIEAAANAVQERASAKDMAELELLLALFSARNLGTGPIMGLIRRLFMNREILEESPLYHWLMQKATEQGMAQGMAQGEERGLREAVLIMLRGRFGEPTADVVQAIEAASRELLSAILLNTATDSLAQVRGRLGLSQDGQSQI